MAEATWAGNRPQRGRASGRVYRTGNWKVTWIDPADMRVDPHLWREVKEAPTAPDFDFANFAEYATKTGDNGGALVGIEAISDFIMREITPPEDAPPPPVAISAAVSSAEKPSATTIREKAARSRRGSRQPARPVEAAKGGAA
jgi:hypothetical protein